MFNMQRAIHLVVVVLLTVSTLSWAQMLYPPSTFPDFSGTITSGVSSTLTAPSSVSSASGSASVSTTVSGNASTTNSAQFPSLSGYSSCVSNCLAMAISSANCSSVTEVDCFCPSNRFAPSLVSCVSSSPCSSELTTAEELAQRFCNILNVTTTLSFPSPSPTPSSSSRTPLSTTSTSTLASSTSSASSANATSASSAPSAALMNDPSVIVTVLGIVLGIFLVH